MPYLRAFAEEEDDDNAPYLAAHSIDELFEVYEELQMKRGSKREVIDRILEGDWRHGLTLYQLAMADTLFFVDHPTVQRWTALRLSKLKSNGSDETTSSYLGTTTTTTTTLPRFHAPTFLTNLQNEISPITNAHYHLTRPSDPSLPVTFVRIYIHDSPYNTQRSLQTASKAQSSSRTLFLAFPDGAPYIYISLSSSSAPTSSPETLSLRKVIIDAVPKALSRPHERYKLEPTNLTTKSLPALLQMRGKDGTNCAQGGWGIFADVEKCGGVLDYRLEKEKKEAMEHKAEVQLADEDKENVSGEGALRKRSLFSRQQSPGAKRKKLMAEGRFGQSGLPDDGKGIERLDVRLDDPFPSMPSKSAGDVGASATQRRSSQQETSLGAQSGRAGRKARPSLLDKSVTEEDQEQDDSEMNDGWIPDVRLSLQGTHIFAGLRQLVEKGIIDGKRMPGWMTGEASISIGVIRDGRIRMKPGRVV